MYGRLGRTAPFTPQARTLLEKVAASLQAGAPLKGWERLAPEIGAICSSPSPLPEGFGFKEPDARAWAAAADAAMRANIARAVEAPVVTGPRAAVPNRLLSGADWDDPAWSRLAVAYFGPGVVGFRERNRWVWERASLALTIQQLLPVTGGRAPKVLLLSSGPEYLAVVLTHLGYDVSYAVMDDLVAGQRSGSWAGQLDLTSTVLPKPLVAHTPGAGGYDALVATLPSLFEAHAAADAVLAVAGPLMAPGALLIATGTVQINEIAYEGGLSFAEWLQLYDPAGPLGMRGFTPAGEMDARIPLDTAVRFAFNDDMGETVAGLSYGFLRGFNTSALISARWPVTLRTGPAARIEYGAANRPDPDAVPIPYTGGQALPFDEALAAASPAAETAAFLARTSLLTAGREALAEAPTLTVGTLPLNVLAHLRPLYRAHRTPLSLELEAPGGAAFLLPVDASACHALRLELDLPAGVTITEAAVVYGWGGSPPTEMEGNTIFARAEQPLGRVAFAVRLSAVKVQMARLILTSL